MNILLQKIKLAKKKSILLLTKPNPMDIHYINFAVTYVCNSRCKHCNIWKKYIEEPEKVQKELKLQIIEDIFNKSQYLKNLQVIDLTGGEPFLRKDFVDLCGFFVMRYPNAKIIIPTNAVNINLVITKLEEIIKRYNPRNIYISISLDGIGETHDNIRGLTGDYARVIKLIELIKNRLPSINQGVSFTLTPLNYIDLLAVYEFSKEMNLNFGIQFAQSSSSFYGNSDQSFSWDKKKLDEINGTIDLIIEELRARLSTIQIIINENLYYLSHMVGFEKNHRMLSKCYSGTHSVFMDAYGNIYPCIMLNQKMGNIFEQDFDKIWISTNAQRIRNFIKHKKCACWTPCETCPSLTRNSKVLLWNTTQILRRKKL